MAAYYNEHDGFAAAWLRKLMQDWLMGIANRVGTLRGAGNALCAPQAEGFIRAYREVRQA